MEASSSALGTVPPPPPPPPDSAASSSSSSSTEVAPATKTISPDDDNGEMEENGGAPGEDEEQRSEEGAGGENDNEERDDETPEKKRARMSSGESPRQEDAHKTAPPPPTTTTTTTMITSNIQERAKRARKIKLPLDTSIAFMDRKHLRRQPPATGSSVKPLVAAATTATISGGGGGDASAPPPPPPPPPPAPVVVVPTPAPAIASSSTSAATATAPRPRSATNPVANRNGGGVQSGVTASPPVGTTTTTTSTPPATIMTAAAPPNPAPRTVTPSLFHPSESGYYDFQFLDVARLGEIDRQLARLRTALRIANGVEEPEASSSSPLLVNTTTPAVASTPAIDQYEREKAALLSSGFPNWSYEEARLFVAVSAAHGRTALDEIAAALASTKTREEVQAYWKTFWERGPTTLAEWNTLVRQIQRGEAKLAEAAEAMRDVHKKIAQSHGGAEARVEDLMWDLDFLPSVRALIQSATTFSIEEDRFLLLGVAGKVRREDAYELPEMAFDHYFHGLTQEERDRRAEFMVRMVRKEFEEMAKTEARKARERTRLEAESAVLAKQEADIMAKIADLERNGLSALENMTREQPQPQQATAASTVNSTSTSPIMMMTTGADGGETHPSYPGNGAAPSPTEGGTGVVEEVSGGGGVANGGEDDDAVGADENFVVPERYREKLLAFVLSSVTMGVAQLVDVIITSVPECAGISKRQLKREIGVLAMKEKRNGDRAARWYPRMPPRRGGGGDAPPSSVTVNPTPSVADESVSTSTDPHDELSTSTVTPLVVLATSAEVTPPQSVP